MPAFTSVSNRSSVAIVIVVQYLQLAFGKGVSRLVAG